MRGDTKPINSSPMPKPNIRAIADWLIDGARSAPLPQDVLSQLCDRLVACGIPLWRVAVFVNTLHPQIIGRRFIWRPDADFEISKGGSDSSIHRSSGRTLSLTFTRPALHSAAGLPIRIA